MRRIAIIGGGIAGVTAAWQVARLAHGGAAIEAVLFETSPRLGGIVETVREQGFTVECGPDAWVTDKPWARELAEELGLGAGIIPSNDATRKTYVLLDGKLVAMPDGMRMMVPRDLAALDESLLFSDTAKAAYHSESKNADELRAAAPEADESVASFIERHFGAEVLEKIGAPLLSGVFGGDVTKLSVRAVMAPFVAMEREHGSLILALQRKAAGRELAVFTTLETGVGTLIEAMVAHIPSAWIRCSTPVTSFQQEGSGWVVTTPGLTEAFDAVLLATPVDVAGKLMHAVDPEAAALMHLDQSSAVVAAFGFDADQPINLPQGFGFLVPPGSGATSLLAATFVDQKFPGRTPSGQRLIRAFFGGATADQLLDTSDGNIAALALSEIQTILGDLPAPILTVVRRWPNALPQYAIGHLERMTDLFARIHLQPGLWLLGNGYRGVGLPDLVRDARAAAHAAASPA